MSGFMNLFSAGDSRLLRQQTDVLLRTNDLTCQFGLTLTPSDAAVLLETCSRALQDNGRIEIGSTIVDKIIVAFCDSPHLNRENYVETIGDLVELFYYMKNETLEQLSDEVLIEQMAHFYGKSAEGSLALLAGRDLEAMARSIRSRSMDAMTENRKFTNREHDEDYEAEDEESWETMRL